MRSLSRVYRCAALTRSALIASAVICAIATGLLAPIERWSGDALVRTAGLLPPPHPYRMPDAAVVAIDARSLRGLPGWPWGLDRHAEAIRRLEAAGARAIVFDIDLSKTDLSGADEFAKAVGRSGRVVVAAASGDHSNTPGKRARSLLDREQVIIDPDGVVRRIALRDESNGEVGLPLAGLELALDEIVGKELPDIITIDARRARPRFPLVSFVDLLGGHFDPGWVAGRVVFIGTTIPGVARRYETILDGEQPEVFIQALAYRTLAAAHAGESTLRHMGSRAQSASVLLLSCLLFGAATLSFSQRMLIAFASAGLILAMSLGGLIGLGILFSPVAPLLVVFAHGLIGLDWMKKRVGPRVVSTEQELNVLAKGAGHAKRPDGSVPEPLWAALSLLGDSMRAESVTLLCCGSGGRLDGMRVDWQSDRKKSKREEGESMVVSLAENVLEEGCARIFDGGIPTPDPRCPLAGVAVYLPLVAEGASVGVLIVERRARSTIEEYELRKIATAGAQIALLTRNMRLLTEIRASFHSAMIAVASAVQAREVDTELHSERLSMLSGQLAARLGLDPEEVAAVEFGALLHDLGKIGIREVVLNKPGRFTREERRDMERHPKIGARIGNAIEGIPQSTVDCILYHHERWDGDGYPEGLTGNAIPIGARIVGVVDVWDALSSSRPHRPARSRETVRNHLLKERGVQFDPEVLDAFIEILDAQDEENGVALAHASVQREGS